MEVFWDGSSLTVSTERGVKGDLVVLEVRVDIAARATRELRQGRAEGGGVNGGALRRQIVGGGAVARQEPHVDVRVRPLHDVEATARRVEARAVVVLRDGLLWAAGVAVARAAVARRGQLGAGQLVALVHGAPLRRVQSDLVGRLRVDALEDVDLALVGPVVAVRPERGPGPAALGHVSNVGDEEHARIGLAGGDAHRGAPVGGVLGRVVGAEVDATVLCFGQLGALGSAGAQILNEAVGRVRLVKEGELVEKVVRVVAGLQGVGIRSRKPAGGKQEGKLEHSRG